VTISCVTNFARDASGALDVDSGGGVRQHDELVRDFSEFLRETKSVVFVNSVAGAGRAERNLRWVRREFERMEMATEFVATASTKDMEAQVGASIAHGARLLFAMGGDGTVQALVNAVGITRPLGDEVVIGIVPSGSGNDFAAALRLPNNPVAAVRAALRGTPRAVDLLRAQTADGTKRLYVGGGGVGLDVEASRYASKQFQNWPGRWRYVASALRAWKNFEPLPVRVEFPDNDQPEIKERVLLVGALNSPSYGAGLRVAKGARIDDGRMDVALVKCLSMAEVARLVPRLLLSGELPEEYLIRRKARSVILCTERPSLFHADGEIIGSAPVRIDVLPRAMRFLAPIFTPREN
jgi:diacylglycerol kinase (ATP)